MAQTAPPTIPLATTRPPELMLVGAQSPTVTVARALGRRTTQGLGHTAPRYKVRMPMGVGEARPFRRMAPLPTANIKRPLREPPRRCTLRTVPRLMARRASTTALRWDRQPMGTSMQQQTATPTRTPVAAGRTLMEVQTNTAAQVTTLLLLGAGVGRKRAADHPLSAEAVAEAGDPGPRVLVVRRAWAAAVAGAAVAVAGEPTDAAANEVNVGGRCW